MYISSVSVPVSKSWSCKVFLSYLFIFCVDLLLLFPFFFFHFISSNVAFISCSVTTTETFSFMLFCSNITSSSLLVTFTNDLCTSRSDHRRNLGTVDWLFWILSPIFVFSANQNIISGKYEKAMRDLLVTCFWESISPRDINNNNLRYVANRTNCAPLDVFRILRLRLNVVIIHKLQRSTCIWRRLCRILRI